MVLVLGSKVAYFQCGRSKWTVCGPKLACFKYDHRLPWFLCGRMQSKLTRFLDAGRQSLGLRVSIDIDLISVRGMELALISVQGSELTWFWCGGRKSLGFSRWIESNLVLVWGLKLTCFLCWVEDDLVFVLRSKLTWFMCGIELHLISVKGSKLTWFQCGGGRYVVWRSKLTCFWCRGITTDLIS